MSIALLVLISTVRGSVTPELETADYGAGGFTLTSLILMTLEQTAAAMGTTLPHWPNTTLGIRWENLVEWPSTSPSFPANVFNGGTDPGVEEDQCFFETNPPANINLLPLLDFFSDPVTTVTVNCNGLNLAQAVLILKSMAT